MAKAQIQSSNVPEVLTLFEWNGVNQSASRSLIDDQELWWGENVIPISTGHLRSAWGPSPPIYTAPAGITVLRLFTANITTNNPSIFVFKSDGTVDRLDLNSGNVIPLGHIWQPVAPNYYADLKLWKPTETGATQGQVGGVVIGSPLGLFAVDGNDVVTGPGAAPPLWLTNNATTDSTGAALVMPSGLPGIYAMEVYQQKLWVAGQTVISFSASTNGADFSTGSGGGSFGYFGDKLTVSYTDLAAAGGYLYLFGDSSIDGIGNVLLIGSGQVGAPFTTTFQLSNIDPQNGQRFHSPVGHWSNSFILFNGSGIYQFQPGVPPAKLISQKIVNLFNSLDTTDVIPSMAPCDIHGRRFMLFNGVFVDPWKVKRHMLLLWDGAIWFVASQHYDLTQITSREQNSSISAYGTDGHVIVRLFNQPDPTLQKLVSTKAFTGPNLLTIKQFKRSYLEMMDRLDPPGPEGVTVTGTISTADGGIPNGKIDVGYDLAPGDFGVVPHPTDGAAGLSAWMDLQALSPDFVFERLHITYDERTLYGA